MKNFIDFIVDSSKDNKLNDGFHKYIKAADHSKLSVYLNDKGYSVNKEECKRMIENQEDIKKPSSLGLFY